MPPSGFGWLGALMFVAPVVPVVPVHPHRADPALPGEEPEVTSSFVIRSLSTTYEM